CPSSAGGPRPGARPLEIDRQACDQTEREGEQDRPSPQKRFCVDSFVFRLSYLLGTDRSDDNRRLSFLLRTDPGSDETRGARNVAGGAVHDRRDESVALARDG